MMYRRSIFLVVLCAAANLPALAGTARYAITAEQVSAAVTNYGMQVTPDQVDLLSGVIANVANPELKLRSIDRMGSERAVARLECANAQQCLPFVVSIRQTATSNAGSSPVPSHLLLASAPTKPAAALVRSGSTAILLLEGTHVHIRLSVICLENGALGQTIRVTDQDRHLTFTARVLQDGILEGRL
jgi:hypothetical protein